MNEIHIPKDLTLLSDQELVDLEVRAVAEFDELSVEALDYQLHLTIDIERLRAATTGRRVERQYLANRRSASENVEHRLAQLRDALQEHVHGKSGGDQRG